MTYNTLKVILDKLVSGKVTKMGELKKIIKKITKDDKIKKYYAVRNMKLLRKRDILL